METNSTAEAVPGAGHELSKATDLGSIDVDETSEPAKTMAIEVILPTMIAAHVKRTLTQRGVALDDFVLELLTRFVPGAIEIASQSVEVSTTDRISKEEEAGS